MQEGSIALGRAPEHQGWTNECPDACNRRSHPMDRQLVAPLRLNPTTIGVKKEEEEKRVRGGEQDVEGAPRLWPWGEPWIPQIEEDAPNFHHRPLAGARDRVN